MTESAGEKTPEIPASAPEPARTGPAKSKTPKPRTPGRRRRRLLRICVAIAIVAIAFRIVLSMMLPWTLGRLAHLYGLNFTYERSDLYLTSGDAGLWHVNVTEADTGKPVANVDYCRADISSLQLMIGRLVVQRLEADGVELNVQRNSDGTIPLLKRLMSGEQASTQTLKTQAGAKPWKIDLSPPVAIDALRLSHVKTHVIDLAVTPPLDAYVEMNLRFSDLASPFRPAKFAMELLPSKLLDSVVVEAEGRSDADSLEATFQFKALGLHPALLAGYLSGLGVKPTASGISMRAGGKIAAKVIAAGPDSLTGRLTLQDIALWADGQDAATLKSMTIDLDSIAPSNAAIGIIAMEDGTFVAQRTAAGGLRVAGIELAPAPGDSPSPSAAPLRIPAPSPGASAFRWSVGELTMKRFNASFIDAAVTPAADLKFDVNDLSMKNIVDDPAKPRVAVLVAGDFGAPGILRQIRVEGKCLPFAAKKSVELNVKAAGVRPDALRAYLEKIGVESDLKEGALTCGLAADVTVLPNQRIAANAELTNIHWKDGRELLVLDDVKIAGAALDAGNIHVDAINVNGPRVAARRDASGALIAGGFRFKPLAASQPVPQPRSESAIARPAAAASLASLPTLDIGSLRWSGIQLQLQDAAGPAKTDISIDDAGIELDHLHLDFNPNAPIAGPGKVKLWLKAPGIAGAFKIEGTVAQRRGGLDADVDIDGEHLSAALTAPYLKALNVEPTLLDGSFHAKAHVDLTQTQDALLADLSVKDVAFDDGSREVFGADEAAISGVSIRKGVAEIGDIELIKPRGVIEREKEGAIRAVGFRLLPPPPEVRKSAFSSVASATTRPAEKAFVETPAPAPAAAPMALVLKKFSISGGAFAWTDRAVDPVARTTARVGGEVAGFTWGRAAEPAAISFTLSADGIANEARIDGTASATPDSAQAALKIRATGLKQGALASYLPPGMTIELKDGRFKANLDAKVAADSARGISGRLALTAVDYRDGANGKPLFAVDAVKLSVARIDIPHGVIAIDEIVVDGAEARGRIEKNGAIHAMGVAIAPVEAPPSRPAAAAPVVSAQAVVDSTPLAKGPLVIVKKIHPSIALKKLDLNLRRIELEDDALRQASPLVVSDLRLVANKPIEALGKEAAFRPAIDLALNLKVEKILDSLSIATQMTPFAAEPTAIVDITGAGLHGDALLAFAPELKSKIDGSGMTDGRFHAHVGVKVRLDRLDPLDFNLMRAFEVDFAVKNVELRGVEKGPLLIGVEEIRSEGVKVHPQSGTVILKTLEINNIAGRVTREQDGIHALGMVVKTSKETAAPTTRAVVVIAAKGKPEVAAPVAAPLSGHRETGEIRIGRVSISGLDFLIADNTVSPPLLVPLNQLDADVRNLSTLEFSQDRPKTKLSLLVGAGKVPMLPKGAKAGTPAEMRDLFSQIQADAELVFYPSAKGWLKMSVSGFDLGGLSPEGKPEGAELAGGVFDAAIEARLYGDDSLRSSSHFIVTDLDYSEDAGKGPIRSAMGFGLPTNAIIGLLEQADKSIDVPLAVSVEEGKLSKGEVIAAAIHAVNAVVGAAVAAAPAKALSAIGLGGEQRAKPQPPVTLTYVAGDDGLTARAELTVAGLVARMAANPNLVVTLRHELSAGDVARAAIRANPDSEECRELISRLERRKADLVRKRVDLLGAARGDLATHPAAEAAPTLDQLRLAERDLAATEDALDKLYDLQRPGAARQAARRTRQAALDIGKARLWTIKETLMAAGIAADRVTLTRPPFNPTAESGGGKVQIAVTAMKKGNG